MYTHAYKECKQELQYAVIYTLDVSYLLKYPT